MLVILPVTEETKATEQTTVEDVVIEETTDIPQSTPKEASDGWEATTESLFGLLNHFILVSNLVQMKQLQQRQRQSQ